MGVTTWIRRMIGGEEEQEPEPTHVCQSCGEEYATSPTIDIDTCRNCGGVKVDRV